MLRELYAIVCVALLLVSCQSNDAQHEDARVTTISIAEFNANPDDYVGQTLEITGTVDHVCKHGGKRMFIMGDDPQQRVKIEASTGIGTFAVELEGSDVTVQGVVKVLKIDEAYLDNQEAEAFAEHGGEGTEQHSAEGEVTEEHHAEGIGQGEHHDDLEGVLAHINAMRRELAESGREYLGIYSLECTSYKELTH